MAKGLELRAQMDAETAKALLVINGGGAIALLSIFTAILGRPECEQLARGILVAVLVMMVGMLLGIAHNRYRRACSLHYELHNWSPPAGTFWGRRLSEPTVCWKGNACLRASLLCFVLAGVIVSGVGLINVEQIWKANKPQATLATPRISAMPPNEPSGSETARRSRRAPP